MAGCQTGLLFIIGFLRAVLLALILVFESKIIKAFLPKPNETEAEINTTWLVYAAIRISIGRSLEQAGSVGFKPPTQCWSSWGNIKCILLAH